MGSLDDLQPILDLVKELGATGLLLYLYARCMLMYQELQKAYFEDLREMAGIKPQLPRNRQNLPIPSE